MNVYLTRNLRSNTLEDQDSAEPLQWIANYTPAQIEIDINEINKDKYITFVNKMIDKGTNGSLYTLEEWRTLFKLEEIKPYQSYVIVGDMKKENGAYIRKSELLLKTDVIAIDYDEIDINADDYFKRLEERLSDIEYYTYPTIKHTDKQTRMRLWVQLDRAITQEEHHAVANMIIDLIDLKCDSASLTWGQLMGLPVVTPLNQNITGKYQQGKPFKVPDNINITKDKQALKRAKIEPIRYDGKSYPINHDTALNWVQNYVQHEGDKLQDRGTPYISALTCIAQAISSNEVTYDTGVEAVKLLACGNTLWESGNVQELHRELRKGQFTTAYTFKDKFTMHMKEERDTLKKLKQRLTRAGFEWREHNKTINDKTGTEKIKPVPYYVMSKILLEHANLLNIQGNSLYETTLMCYDPDNGIYRSERQFLEGLMFCIEPTSSTNTRKEAYAQVTLICDTKILKEDSNYIVFKNGIYNKVKKELEPFTPDRVFIKKIDTNYNPDATEPEFNGWRFSEWLQTIAGNDKEKHTLLWQLIASIVDMNSITGVAFLIYSRAASTGKSTFQELLQYLVGANNYDSLRISEFDNPFHVAKVYGKILIVGDDNDPDSFNKSSQDFKSTITGNLISIEHKFARPFPYRPLCTIVQSMNELPKFKDTTEGIDRRLRVIEFKNVFEGSKKNAKVQTDYITDKRLHEWIVKESLKYLVEGLPLQTEESNLHVREMLSARSPVFNFLEDKLDEFKSQRIPTTLLFQYFNYWNKYENNSNVKMSNRSFTQQLQSYERHFEYDYKHKSRASGFFYKDDYDRIENEISRDYFIELKSYYDYEMNIHGFLIRNEGVP